MSPRATGGTPEERRDGARPVVVVKTQVCSGCCRLAAWGESGNTFVVNCG